MLVDKSLAISLQIWNSGCTSILRLTQNRLKKGANRSNKHSWSNHWSFIWNRQMLIDLMDQLYIIYIRSLRVNCNVTAKLNCFNFIRGISAATAIAWWPLSENHVVGHAWLSSTPIHYSPRLERHYSKSCIGDHRCVSCLCIGLLRRCSQLQHSSFACIRVRVCKKSRVEAAQKRMSQSARH